MKFFFPEPSRQYEGFKSRCAGAGQLRGGVYHAVGPVASLILFY